MVHVPSVILALSLLLFMALNSCGPVAPSVDKSELDSTSEVRQNMDSRFLGDVIINSGFIISNEDSRYPNTDGVYASIKKSSVQKMRVTSTRSITFSVDRSYDEIKDVWYVVDLPLEDVEEMKRNGSGVTLTKAENENQVRLWKTKEFPNRLSQALLKILIHFKK